MVKAEKYLLPPTPSIPNSRFPLLVYRGVLADPSSRSPEQVWDMFNGNGWPPQWIFRYGPNQSSHYHSKTHECMAVLTGNARIRFGVGDIIPKSHDVAGESVFGEDGKPIAQDPGKQTIDWSQVGQEEGGVEIDAKAGDVFVIPAGVSHKTYNTSPASSLMLLTPGDGHGIASEDKRKTLANIELSGFTMLGAYPRGGEWDFAIGGEDAGQYENVWSVPKPQKDPVLGAAKEGLCGLWQSERSSKL